jgi:hypothetical protein
MRATLAMVSIVIGLGACTEAEVQVVVNQELADVAYDLCPILWQWQLGIGGTMNDMSYEAFREDDPGSRLDLYLDAMEESRRSLDDLRDRLAGLPGNRFHHFFREEVEKGLVQAEKVIDESEAEIKQLHAEGDPTYKQVVPRLFLSFEKVIDLAKPELASYGDPELIPAFQTVAQCQHGVKDADDGVPRYVPLQPPPTG